eukprot:329562-Chlamydomonas_euryale.AAC.2
MLRDIAAGMHYLHTRRWECTTPPAACCPSHSYAAGVRLPLDPHCPHHQRPAPLSHTTRRPAAHPTPAPQAPPAPPSSTPQAAKC